MNQLFLKLEIWLNEIVETTEEQICLLDDEDKLQYMKVFSTDLSERVDHPDPAKNVGWIVSLHPGSRSRDKSNNNFIQLDHYLVQHKDFAVPPTSISQCVVLLATKQRGVECSPDEFPSQLGGKQLHPAHF